MTTEGVGRRAEPDGQPGQGWQLLSAAGFVTMPVPILVFQSPQRFFVRGMTSGAVKG